MAFLILIMDHDNNINNTFNIIMINLGFIRINNRMESIY